MCIYQSKFYANFNNIALIVSKIDYKLDYPKKLIKTIFSLIKLIISKIILFFLLLSKVKQFKSFVFFILAIFFPKSKTTFIFSILIQMTITVFK